jgi:hypothetical protein
MTKRQIKKKTLEFISDGDTWKIVEIMHGIFCPYEELLPALIELEAENKIDMGGYEEDPEHWKFVRFHTDKLPGMEHMISREFVAIN